MEKSERAARLMPKGIPRWIRIYDNGNETVDRYTVVFTGHFKGRMAGWSYGRGMSENPFHPQGVGMWFEYDCIIDRPRYRHLGKRITFAQLPEQCQMSVLQDYRELWGLSGLAPEVGSLQ